MGTWGIGVWQDDVAGDVVGVFEDLLESGNTAAQAVEAVLLDPPWGWDDEDDEVVQILALAALALQHRVLASGLRDRALSILESGVALERWSDSRAELIAARMQLLEQYQALLRQGAAPADELASVTRPEAFSYGPWR